MDINEICMTNVEVLEQRYPDVQVEHFGLRSNSGERGRYLGGD